MQKKPLVSILIASFNKEKLVKRCINSCIKQTYKNIEIIFVDNDSSDNSYKIAKQFKNIKVYKKKRVKYSNFRFNSFNQTDTYLYAFKKSKGNIICFLDSDDFFKKNKVYEIVNYFLKNPKNNIIFDKPIIFFDKKKKYNSKEFNKNINRNFLWPKFPPQSCISIKRFFLNKIINEISKKKFELLALDFKIATVSKYIYNEFNIIEKFLTYYFQDLKGESYSNYKKFNFNWWIRRLSAHKYLKYISTKYKKNHINGLDYFFTRIIVLLLSTFKKNI